MSAERFSVGVWLPPDCRGRRNQNHTRVNDTGHFVVKEDDSNQVGRKALFKSDGSRAARFSRTVMSTRRILSM